MSNDRFIHRCLLIPQWLTFPLPLSISLYLCRTKGFQVAPAELEGLILQHPAVMDAAVLGKPDAKLGEVPVAFVVTKKAALAASNPEAAAKIPDVSADSIKAFVAGKVADYKQLSEVRFINAVPRNPSGKILRRILRTQLAQL